MFFTKDTTQRLEALRAEKTKALGIFKKAHDDLSATQVKYQEELKLSREYIEELKKDIHTEEVIIDDVQGEMKANDALLSKISEFLGVA